MTQAVSQTKGLEVSQRAKENLLYIGTNLKGDRLKVPDDPGCEPDGGLGGVPEGEGALTCVTTHHCCQLNVHRLKHTLHHLPIVVIHLSGIKQFFADVVHFFECFLVGLCRPFCIF
jgi:hypothetical protein